MAGFWKLKKEWVLERGLTASEALLYSDILSWNKPCTLEERARRVGMSIEGVRKMLKKIEEKGLDFQQSGKENSTKLKSNFNIVEKNTNKVEKIKKEKKKVPPIPPIKNKRKSVEEHEEHISPSASDGGEKKEEVKVYSLQYRCQKFFEQTYQQYKNASYRYNGRDAAALKGLINALKFTMRSEGRDDNDNDTELFFQDFINTLFIVKPDRWIDEHFSLSNINSKFNEIYSQLRNGKSSTKRQQGVTDEFIRGIAERLAESGGLAF